ncbi:MAG TPA: GxxExxY protein [Longimicrobiales bacterium]
MNINEVTSGIIGAAIHVHRELGPGLLESAYEACLAYELIRRGFDMEVQKAVPLTYQGVQLDCGYRLDMVVNNCVIVELKAVEKLDPVHTATVLTYLKLTNLQVALLINFNVALLKNGIHRIVLNYRDPQMSSAPSAPLR